MADSTNHYARHTPRDRDLRASDRDRDAVGDFLRRQHVAGRLDTDEFADRYGRCLEAKTYAQLDALITDLPADEQTAPAGGPERVRGGRRGYGATYGAPWRTGRRPWPVPAFAWLAMVLVLAMIGGGHLFWIVVPLFFFVVVRPLMWRSAWRHRRGAWGPWSCPSGFAGPGTTTL